MRDKRVGAFILEKFCVDTSQPNVARIAVEAFVPIQRDLDFRERDGWRQNFYARKPLHGFSQPGGDGGNQVGACDQRCNGMKVRYPYSYTRCNFGARQRPFENCAMV